MLNSILAQEFKINNLFWQRKKQKVISGINDRVKAQFQSILTAKVLRFAQTSLVDQLIVRSRMVINSSGRRIVEMRFIPVQIEVEVRIENLARI